MPRNLSQLNQCWLQFRQYMLQIDLEAEQRRHAAASERLCTRLHAIERALHEVDANQQMEAVS